MSQNTSAPQFRQRCCPICGKASSRTWLPSKVDFDALDRFAFASRKAPEYMRFALGLCEACDLVFAESVPQAQWYQDSYREADFDAENESHYAARTYGKAMRRILPQLAGRSAALDIGAGDGAFVAQLVQAGFEQVIGIEPSVAPVSRAAPDIKPLLRNDFFRAEDFAAASFDLVTCFQTIEHLEDPLAFCKSAARILRPGGALLMVSHNFRAPLARLLGERSPIYDIEHLQLFSPRSVKRLYEAAGLHDVDVKPLSNTYPLRYWFRLAPLPGALKTPISKMLVRSSLGRLPLSARVGNSVTVGFKR
jgi:SAM-dependent methyltransferase